MTILLTGATGRIGGLVAQKLLEMSTTPVRLLVRNPAKLNPYLAQQAEVVQGDLADPASLAAACSDLTAVLIVSPVSPNQHELQSNLVNAVSAAGDSNRDTLVVKISGLGTALNSPVTSGHWHAQTEQAIINSHLPFTFLRPLYFMQNLGFALPQIKADGKLIGAVGSERIAMVHVADIASTAACLLAGHAQKTNQALTLTSSEALSYDDVAVKLSEALKREVVYQPQTLDQLSESLKQKDESDWHRELVVEFSRAFAAGWANQTTDAVLEVTQSPPIDLDAFLANQVAAGIKAPNSNHNPFPS